MPASDPRMTTHPSDDIEALRTLSKAATPGPWAVMPREFDDWGEVRSIAALETKNYSLVCVARGDDDEREESRARAEHRQPRIIGANSEFIVALVNAYRTGRLVLVSEPAQASTYQSRVQPWLDACFGREIAIDRIERNHRFLEESLEAVQANGCSRDEAHQLVDYVFDRPVGELHQEIGGVMNTLAALCLASGIDMHEAGATELTRVWTKVEQIRAKQAAKPKHSPLPGPSSKPAQAGVPEGWRLAPVEPTPGMIEAGVQDGRDFEGRPLWKQSYDVQARERYRAMLSAAPEPPRQDGWQPIETAPKDGTEFVGSCQGYASFSCRWFQGQFVHIDLDDGLIAYPITDWIPLPSPKRTESGR